MPSPEVVSPPSPEEELFTSFSWLPTPRVRITSDVPSEEGSDDASVDFDESSTEMLEDDDLFDGEAKLMSSPEMRSTKLILLWVAGPQGITVRTLDTSYGRPIGGVEVSVDGVTSLPRVASTQPSRAPVVSGSWCEKSR